MDKITMLLGWAHTNPWLLLIAGLVALCLLVLRRYARLDRAERVFRRARLRVPAERIDQLREEYIRVALESERQRLAESTRQQAELEAIQREKERILSMVRSTPLVVKEAGAALQAIEREYERNLRSVKSEQAREGLRLAAQRQIHEVLKSVLSDQAKLPPFEIPLDCPMGERKTYQQDLTPEPLADAR